jgi:glycosyltransferase involved in cell wall biosynthesis
MERYHQLQLNPSKKVYARLEAWKVRHWERKACSRMKAVLTCSHVDRSILQRLCPTVPMHVIPNAVDTEHYVPMGTPEPRTVLFQGGMDWHPNRDAVQFFACDIFPRLRRLVPGVKFRAAGRLASEAFRRRFDKIPDVEFTGTIPDMRTEIAKATVCIVPLRIGSGTRLKILEAAAMAKPIVSTRMGAEGLDFIAGEEILLADEPTHFVATVAGLLKDEARRKSLGRLARLRVERQYSFPVVRSALSRVLEEVRQ